MKEIFQLIIFSLLQRQTRPWILADQRGKNLLANEMVVYRGGV